MAGVEVVGIVLGSIPLVISALEHYGDIVRTFDRWRFTVRELESLKRRLGTQHAIFVNTCENLLRGIVPATYLEAMIAEPFGPLWQDTDIKYKIEMRLDHVVEPFRNTAKIMVEAVEQFKNRLGLDENGEVGWTEAKAIVRKRKRVTFTINRSHFNDLLDTLSEGNKDLITLTNQSVQLEPGRNAGYQGRLLVRLHDISESAYTAMSKGFPCNCPTAHGVTLEMATPSLTSTDKNEQVLQNAVFRCIFSFLSDHQNTGADVRRWEKVLLKLEAQKSAQNKLTQTPLPSNTARPRTSERFREGLKSVKFALQSTLGGGTDVQQSTNVQPQSNYSPRILVSNTDMTDMDATLLPVNLCHIIRKQGKSPYVPCYGYIADQSVPQNSRFGVYPPGPHEDDENITLLSLNLVLEDKGLKFPQIPYRQRMKLAVDISSSLLQLNGTPWFPDILTSKDIYFIARNEVPIYDQAFVAKGPRLMVVPQAGPDSTTQRQSRVSSRSLSALGTILVELLLLRTLDHLWTPSCHGKMADVTTTNQTVGWKATKDTLDQVEVIGGSNYYSAVRRLLFEFTHVDTSQDEEVTYTEIYGKTISLLVENSKLSQF
ncbi:hypothetical protein F5B20DRAFT_526715 [Whalleya microplaca]|nr:hypothetical protein F5B20DRAFT_526715 [Whalleya microplaca]